MYNEWQLVNIERIAYTILFPYHETKKSINIESYNMGSHHMPKTIMYTQRNTLIERQIGNTIHDWDFMSIF